MKRMSRIWLLKAVGELVLEHKRVEAILRALDAPRERARAEGGRRDVPPAALLHSPQRLHDVNVVPLCRACRCRTHFTKRVGRARSCPLMSGLFQRKLSI